MGHTLSRPPIDLGAQRFRRGRTTLLRARPDGRAPMELPGMLTDHLLRDDETSREEGERAAAARRPAAPNR